MINKLIKNVRSVADLTEEQERDLKKLFENTINPKSKCDVDEIVKIFNERFNGVFPRVQAVTSQRIKLVNARFKEYGYDGIRTVFDKAESSEFLRKGNGTWKCSFDFLFSPSGFVKTLEGNYDGKSTNNSKEVSVGDDIKANILRRMLSVQDNR